MIGDGYIRCHSNHYVYFMRLNDKRYIILLLYVHDMIVGGANLQNVNVLKRKLANTFVMKVWVLQNNPWYENKKRQKKSQINIVSE